MEWNLKLDATWEKKVYHNNFRLFFFYSDPKKLQ